MYWLKTCPRCSGDLHQEEDFYGKYIACVQCGYTLTSTQEETLRATGTINEQMALAAEVVSDTKVA